MILFIATCYIIAIFLPNIATTKIFSDDTIELLLYLFVDDLHSSVLPYISLLIFELVIATCYTIAIFLHNISTTIINESLFSKNFLFNFRIN